MGTLHEQDTTTLLVGSTLAMIIALNAPKNHLPVCLRPCCKNTPDKTLLQKHFLM